MKKITRFFEQHELIVSIITIILVTLIAYIPSLKGAGYYGDDYHILYGGYTSGIERLLEIAKIDRPVQGITFTMYFPLLGINIHAYQVFELCTNMLTSLMAFWLIRMVWPRQKSAAFALAILFSIYPGYTDHLRSFNFSLFMFNIFLYILSIALSTKALLVRKKTVKVLLFAVSICTFIWSALLNEYYIGLELLRLGIFLVIISKNENQVLKHRKIFTRTLIIYIPYLVAGIGFFIWRFFIFSNQRNATNLGSFTSAFTSSPIYESISILKGLFTNFLNVTVLAWMAPLYKYFNLLRLKDFIFCAAIALAGAFLFFLVYKLIYHSLPEEKNETKDWLQMLIISALTVFGTLFPIVFVNRNATFDYYGRYALPGMICGILFLVALIHLFVKHPLRLVLICFAIFSGIFVQLGIGKGLATDWQGSKDLWWQLSWRAPSLKPGTLLTGLSSEYGIQEGFNLWAPANLIYYPKETNPVINGETLNIGFIQLVMEDKDTTRDFRSFLLSNQSENLLVLSKPSSNSCLHLINNKAETYSTYDSANILLIGKYSHLDQVDTSAQPLQPPAEIFGVEPVHDWCYYYQKADLALQKGEFDEVVRLKNEAADKGLKQEDASELLPFILAYAQNCNEVGLKELLPIYMDSQFLKVNYCQNLLNHNFNISETANELLLNLSCLPN